MSHPFKCMADDGEYYWCKGLQIGKYQSIDMLRREWVGGFVIKKLGLPVCKFEALECDPDMAKEWYAQNPNGGPFTREEAFVDKSMHVVFGSQHIADVNDLQDLEFLLQNGNASLMAKVFLADRIIRNTDRVKINSNILLTMNDRIQFTLIDHGNSFNPEYLPSDFKDDHIFSPAYFSLNVDTREALFDEVASVLTPKLVEEAWALMPDAWRQRPPSGYAICLDEMKSIVKLEVERHV